MKKILFLIIIFTLTTNVSMALDIVYPKKNPAKINAASTFFIGSGKPNSTIKINDIEIKTSNIGAFASMVSLKNGINDFKIINENDIVNFKIERPNLSKQKIQQPEIIKIQPMLIYVLKDNAPLRSTPLNSGINRLSHLPKDTGLIIDAEKGDFFRVYLNKDEYGWISKNDTQNPQPTTRLAEIKNVESKNTKNYCIYKIELNDKVPFKISEENGITVDIYNILGQENETYKLNIPTDKLIGYNYEYENNTFTIKIKKTPKVNQKHPLKNLTITIDAGHGGCELGAIGCCGDKEKDINLSIAKNLQKELELKGAKVIMTRTEDKQISLDDRVKTAKDSESDLLISIHANAIPDGQDPIKNRGTSVYYYHQQAKPLAENILKSMTEQLGTNNDKVRQGSLALVRPTHSVSVLVEVGYIINPDDYALLLDKTFQINCAKSITDGIKNYILEFND